jgi:sugar phosphate isomerase/epimerase
MKSCFDLFPFPIAAPTMVYGPDLLANVERLRSVVRHLEVVLFWTPERHTIPSRDQVEILADRLNRHGLHCTVHLPAALQIAAEDPDLRRWSVERVEDIVERMAGTRPRHYVLHVPVTEPTLAPVPGLYFTEREADRFSDWFRRARRSLEHLARSVGSGNRILVENINFSPSFLYPFCREGLCGLCLDIGHLLLGGETVGEVLDTCFPLIEEIHLHGVRGWEEHLGLDVVEPERLLRWMNRLRKGGFGGVLNLEVFSERDLVASLASVREAWNTERRSSP